MKPFPTDTADTKECLHYADLARALTLFTAQNSAENNSRQVALYIARAQCINSQEQHKNDKVTFSRR